jgi:hypothetical protein
MGCGHVFRTQFQPQVNQTQAFNAPYAPIQSTTWFHPNRTQPHTEVIILMWVLQAAAILLGFFSPIIGLCGLAALGCAIYLVCQVNRTDRMNGWIYIGLSLAGIVLFLVFCFFLGMGLAAMGRIPHSSTNIPSRPPAYNMPMDYQVYGGNAGDATRRAGDQALMLYQMHRLNTPDAAAPPNGTFQPHSSMFPGAPVRNWNTLPPPPSVPSNSVTIGTSIR